MKKFASIIIVLLMLLSCIGCDNSTTVVEEIVPAVTEESEVSEEVTDPLTVGVINEDGTTPSGILFVNLEGSDSDERLYEFYDFAKSLFSQASSKMGVTYTDTGAMLTMMFTDAKASMRTAAEEVKSAAQEYGFNEENCKITVDMATPPFKFSEFFLRMLFDRSAVGDAICTTCTFTADNMVRREEAQKVQQRNAYEGRGFGNNAAELPLEAFKMASRGDWTMFHDAHDGVYVQNDGATIIDENIVSAPDYILGLPVNLWCDEIPGVKEGTLAINGVDGFMSRGTRVLEPIFGKELLQRIYEVAMDEAITSLDLGTEYLLNSNWGMVYTDVQGNFRVRTSLIVKNPEGKTGWYVGAYDIVVVPVEGDMFTCSEYAATGEIIPLMPLVTLDTSLRCGEEDEKYGLTTVEVCHIFAGANKFDLLVSEFPTISAEHYAACDVLPGRCPLR